MGVPYNCWVCQRNEWLRARGQKPMSVENFDFGKWALRSHSDKQLVVVLQYMPYWPNSHMQYRPHWDPTTWSSSDLFLTQGHTQRFKMCPEHYEKFVALAKESNLLTAWHTLRIMTQ